jgi:hypothetical protein
MENLNNSNFKNSIIRVNEVDFTLPDSYHEFNGQLVKTTYKKNSLKTDIISPNMIIPVRVMCDLYFISYKRVIFDVNGDLISSSWEDIVLSNELISNKQKLKQYLSEKGIYINDLQSKLLSDYIISFVNHNPKIKVIDNRILTHFIYNSKKFDLPLGFFIKDNKLNTIFNFMFSSFEQPIGVRKEIKDIDTKEIIYTVFFMTSDGIVEIDLKKDELEVLSKFKNSKLTKIDYPIRGDNVNLFHFYINQFKDINKHSIEKKELKTLSRFGWIMFMGNIYSDLAI